MRDTCRCGKKTRARVMNRVEAWTSSCCLGYVGQGRSWLYDWAKWKDGLWIVALCLLDRALNWAATAAEVVWTAVPDWLAYLGQRSWIYSCTG